MLLWLSGRRAHLWIDWQGPQHPGDLGDAYAFLIGHTELPNQFAHPSRPPSPSRPRYQRLAGWLAGIRHGPTGSADKQLSRTLIHLPKHDFLFATLPGSFLSIASRTGLWRRTLRIPKRVICSGSSLRERNWTGSSQLVWPLLHILDGQMLDCQCLVACMHAKKLGRPRRIWGSEDHPTAPVTQRMQRRRQPARTLVENGGAPQRRRPCHGEPRPAGCVRMCSCQCSAAGALAGCRIPRPVCREGYGTASVRLNVHDATSRTLSSKKSRIPIEFR